MLTGDIVDEVARAKSRIKTQLADYCESEAFRLTQLAGLEPQHISNANYLSVRNSMYYNLPKDQVHRAVFDLTTLLQVVGIVGYPHDNNE
jgi:hypothetical protein